MTEAIAHTRLAFEAARGRPPTWCWFVPGRIEVFGKHTDYAGGRSLVAAVNRGFTVAAMPRGDGLVRVLDVKANDEITLDPTDRTTPVHGWRNYVAVVARRLATNFPGAAVGIDVAIASSLPRAAGVSSSSALVVGIASAMVRRGRLDERPEWREAITSPLDLAGYLGAVENGLSFKTLTDTSGVGTHGGSEDHTAILDSQADHLQAYAYLPVRRLGRVRLADTWTFAVMSSGVHASKAGRARERYNRASLATRALLTLWNDQAAQSATCLAEALASAPNAAIALEAMARERGQDGFNSELLIRRLAHFVAEDARVPAALAAFAHFDAATLGRLSDDSQREADDLLGNQVDETRELTRLARLEGAVAASSFGAGFGGSVWALIGTDVAEDFVARWQAAYRAQFPNATNVEAFITRPSQGAAELD